MIYLIIIKQSVTDLMVDADYCKVKANLFGITKLNYTNAWGPVVVIYQAAVYIL